MKKIKFDLQSKNINQPPRCKHSVRLGEGAGEPALSPGVAGSRCLGKRQRVVRQPALNHPGGSRSGGHPGVCGACAGHRPQPGSRQPRTWDGAGPPPRDPRPPADLDPYPAPPHRPRDTPQLPGSARQARAPAQSRRPGPERGPTPRPPTLAAHGLTPTDA